MSNMLRLFAVLWVRYPQFCSFSMMRLVRSSFLLLVIGCFFLVGVGWSAFSWEIIRKVTKSRPRFFLFPVEAFWLEREQ